MFMVPAGVRARDVVAVMAGAAFAVLGIRAYLSEWEAWRGACGSGRRVPDGGARGSAGRGSGPVTSRPVCDRRGTATARVLPSCLSWRGRPAPTVAA
ncbi:hypothetical protein GCM10010451_43120 [Streptomyces virens]|uniref:Uncharacterized protein n=1 Tax=Streptomyces virens TaxID=285572 RepID=A0ABP6PTF5_9ACTN